jgi:hypothetical protein
MTAKPALEDTEWILHREEQDKCNHENIGKNIPPDEYIRKWRIEQNQTYKTTKWQELLHTFWY